MRLGVFVPECERVPDWYGFAYRCWDRYGAIAYPVPLNLLVRLLRPLWLWVKNPLASIDADALIGSEVYTRGRRRGFENGARAMAIELLQPMCDITTPEREHAMNVMVDALVERAFPVSSHD